MPCGLSLSKRPAGRPRSLAFMVPAPSLLAAALLSAFQVCPASCLQPVPAGPSALPPWDTQCCPSLLIDHLLSPAPRDPVGSLRVPGSGPPSLFCCHGVSTKDALSAGPSRGFTDTTHSSLGGFCHRCRGLEDRGLGGTGQDRERGLGPRRSARWPWPPAVCCLSVQSIGQVRGAAHIPAPCP